MFNIMDISNKEQFVSERNDRLIEEGTPLEETVYILAPIQFSVAIVYIDYLRTEGADVNNLENHIATYLDRFLDEKKIADKSHELDIYIVKNFTTPSKRVVIKYDENVYHFREED